MVPRAQWATVIACTAAIGGHLPVLAQSREDAINKRMRVQIRNDIKAHGQAFAGPDHLPSALLKVIAGKRLVGLGEGSHDTSEIQSFYGNLFSELPFSNSKSRAAFWARDLEPCTVLPEAEPTLNHAESDGPLPP